jgi:hypothetical protein
VKLAAGRGAERTTKRLPSCSISVSVREPRSAERCNAVLQDFRQHQREETAEHVTGLIELVVADGENAIRLPLDGFRKLCFLKVGPQWDSTALRST